MEKEKGLSPWMAGVLLYIVAIAFYFTNRTYMTTGGAVDLNAEIRKNPELTASEIYDMDHVRVTIDSCFGPYAEENIHYSYFIPGGTKEFYVAMLDDGSLLSVSVKEGDASDIMNRISEKTVNSPSLRTFESYEIEGTVSILREDDYPLGKYYKSALTKLGAYGEDGKAIEGLKIRHVTVDGAVNRKTLWKWFFIIIIVATLGVSSDSLSRYFKKRREKKAEALAAATKKPEPAEPTPQSTYRPPESFYMARPVQNKEDVADLDEFLTEFEYENGGRKKKSDEPEKISIEGRNLFK